MVRIFCNNVRNKLERHIKGEIKVRAIGNDLHCTIRNEDFTFHYNYADIFNTDTPHILSVALANDIIQEYLYEIKSRYLK